MQSICVYLGAMSGASSAFSQSVITLGQNLAKRNLTLVYGGSSLGTMGLLADTVHSNGGRVEGVITEHLLPLEKPDETVLDNLDIVKSMEKRKMMLQEKANMFLVMPGGLGTLEEVGGTWNAIKIGLFDKPLGFFNLDGYFDKLMEYIETCVEGGFVSEIHQKIPFISSDLDSLLDEMIKRSSKSH